MVEPTIQTLHDTVIYELTKAFGLLQTPGAKRIVEWAFGKAAWRVATLGVGLDRVVAEGGVYAGARWLLPHFVAGHTARGVETIPADGPLVIASNHPAGVDSLVISAYVTRPDYKIIVGDIPFFETLPHVSQYAIYAPDGDDPHGRMRAMRAALRHLKSGGALLIFARGAIEADPDLMPNADGEFDQWSRSLEIFLRQVPETRVLVTIASGTIARAAMNSPLTRIRTARPDRQRIAFLTQLARQILSGREMFGLRPRVTFGEVIAGSRDHVVDQIHSAAQRVLCQHMEWKV